MSSIKARTSLGRIEGIVTGNESIWITFFQFFQQDEQFLFLGWRACIGRLTACIQAAFVADAYGVVVVPLAVGTHLTLSPTQLHRAVAADHVVVANATPAHLAVPEVYLEGT